VIKYIYVIRVVWVDVSQQFDFLYIWKCLRIFFFNEEAHGELFHIVTISSLVKKLAEQ
jgi:hypothetical protein